MVRRGAADVPLTADGLCPGCSWLYVWVWRTVLLHVLQIESESCAYQFPLMWQTLSSGLHACCKLIYYSCGLCFFAAHHVHQYRSSLSQTTCLTAVRLAAQHSLDLGTSACLFGCQTQCTL